MAATWISPKHVAAWTPPQEATAVQVTDPFRRITLSDGSEINCRALLIATGVQYRKLEAPGVAELTGAGVYYGAAITEATFYRGQDVVVLGGGNSAGQAAVYLSGYARSVTLVVRASDLGMALLQRLEPFLEFGNDPLQ